MSMLKELAYKIAELLEKHRAHIDVCIYFEGRRLSYVDGVWEDIDGFDVTEYVEYNNPKTITMTFEGAFYQAINYMDNEYDKKLIDEFNELLRKYRFYGEQGYAWSLALYEL